MSPESGRVAASQAASPASLSLRARLKRGIRWSLPARLVALASGFAVNALLARLLVPTDLGAYYLASTVVALTAIVSQIGLNQAVVRTVAEAMALGRAGRARASIVGALRTTVVLSLGVGVLVLLTGRWVAHAVFDSKPLAGVVVLAAVLVPLTALRLLVPEVFRGLHDLKWASIFGDGGTNLTLAVAFAVFVGVAHHSGLHAAVLVVVADAAILAALSLVVLAPRVPAADGAPRAVRQLLRLSTPLLAANLSWTILNQIDTIILGAFRPERDVAYFNASDRVADGLLLPLLIVNAVIAPMVSELWARGEAKRLERLLRVMASAYTALAGLGLLILVVAGRWGLGLIFGDFYRRGFAVLVVLAVGTFYSTACGSCALALTMTGHQVAAMTATLGFAVLTIGATFATAYYWGPVGVAITMSAGAIAQNTALVLIVRRRLGIWTQPMLAPWRAW